MYVGNRVSWLNLFMPPNFVSKSYVLPLVFISNSLVDISTDETSSVG